ncbi:cytochrome P450 [Kibdelosporangium phytohabitans]|uniref:Cytochrome n=1 Tax=Kibdelosporangium phytohabitans TaxID=860235 RepID=A0A0N9HZP5_9PSEU|nr:cytochrome P450 [Kibdelosporangium phytohabitans]ALG12805.1 cytochrome [Kibdelosporangium phytohabitans]MBE1464489.1 cytochrome P450 [Kibdelosporangium phytohabitans]
MIDPFTAATRGMTEPNPVPEALRAAGPLVAVDAPAGGQVWIVTDGDLVKQVMADPRIVKDPAMAPEDWDPMVAGLEPPAALRPSLTTLDGPAHTALRRVQAPLLTGKRIRERQDRIEELAHEMLMGLGEGAVDLMADFTVRFPLAVLLDMMAIPPENVSKAVDACRHMDVDQVAAIETLMDIAATAQENGLAAELRERLAGTPEDELRYHLFGLILASQVTTDAAIGYVVARMLGTPSDDPVAETLRENPPAPFSLWRFTAGEMELAGTRLPARAPILVDLAGLGLTFGAGAHYCVGAQLAQAELHAVRKVLARDFPSARLTVPYEELMQVVLGGIAGTRLKELPVVLR